MYQEATTHTADDQYKYDRNACRELDINATDLACTFTEGRLDYRMFWKYSSDQSGKNELTPMLQVHCLPPPYLTTVALACQDLLPLPFVGRNLVQYKLPGLNH